jgi:hypothetical protein
VEVVEAEEIGIGEEVVEVEEVEVVQLLNKG